MERAPTVLVADASEAIRILLTAFFSRAGFAVDSAGTIDSALSKLRCAQFDVLMIDPACSNDGDGLAHVAAAFPAMIGRTVVLASPPQPRVRQDVHAVIEKPFELEKLLRAALECCRS